MIERIQIQNFQVHDKMRIVFDPSVTTIVGPSDSGKSAILRAIRWVVFNRPRGTSFIHHGEDLCKVKIWIDGHTVERKRTKTGNLYLIDGKRLAAVGVDVPEPVLKLLNLVPENFQGQHDSPFWFGLTPGEVAKRLNAIVDLEVIDKSASWLASEARKAKAELMVTERNAKDAVGRAKALGFVKQLEVDFDKLEASALRFGTCVSKQESVEAILTRAREAAERARIRRQIVSEGSAVLDAGKAAQGLYKRSQGLRTLIGAAQRTREASERPVPDLSKVSEAFEAARLKAKREAWLRELIRDANEGCETADHIHLQLEKAKRRLASKTKGRCPVCGGRLK